MAATLAGWCSRVFSPCKSPNKKLQRCHENGHDHGHAQHDAGMLDVQPRHR
jgi:hypothetical protein